FDDRIRVGKKVAERVEITGGEILLCRCELEMAQAVPDGGLLQPPEGVADKTVKKYQCHNTNGNSGQSQDGPAFVPGKIPQGQKEGHGFSSFTMAPSNR